GRRPALVCLRHPRLRGGDRLARGRGRGGGGGPPARLAVRSQAGAVARRTRRSARRMSTMRAAVFCGDGRVELRQVTRPVPAREEVCVRLEGCGVCASNLPVWSGKPWFDYPLVPGAPGHEGWGEV